MADTGDLAAEREAVIREAALAASRRRRNATGDSAYFCRSCGERIPDGRREAVPGTNVCGFCARQLSGTK